MKSSHLLISLIAGVVLSFWTVAALGQGAVELDVDCDAGDSLHDAIRTEGDYGAPLTLNVTGTCYEHARVSRDLVTINGGGTAVVHGTITNWGTRFTVRNITITGDSDGFVASDGRARLINVDISDNYEAGIVIFRGGSVSLNNSRVHHNGLAGISIETGFLTVSGSEIAGNEIGIDAVMGRVTLEETDVVENRGAGIKGTLHSSILAKGPVQIERNGEHGVLLSLDSGFLSVDAVSINDNGRFDVVCKDRESSAKFEDLYPGRVWCSDFRW